MVTLDRVGFRNQPITIYIIPGENLVTRAFLTGRCWLRHQLKLATFSGSCTFGQARQALSADVAEEDAFHDA